MKKHVFKQESTQLYTFIHTYCVDSHPKEMQIDETVEITYKGEPIDTLGIELCPSCLSHYRYAMERLSACPHDPKPKCRRCKESCYEAQEWKAMAKIMRYSGIKLGFIRLARKMHLKA